MLKENTGRHFLDSGGAYGRNWERNQTRQFLTEKAIITDIYSANNISVTLNVFHYLSENLRLDSYTTYLNRLFSAFCRRKDNSENWDLTNMEEFTREYEEKGIFEEVTDCVNTYNYQNILSQVLQYVTFEFKNSKYILLQVHGGCDVRGGYGTPYIFEISDYDNFIMQQFDVSASDGVNSWYSDDSGCNYYPNNSEPDFEDVAICIDGKIYNKMNGKRITFGNSSHSEEGEGEILPQLPDVATFVQNNYLKPDLMELVKAEFSEFMEESGLNIEEFAQKAINEIENNTLDMFTQAETESN